MRSSLLTLVTIAIINPAYVPLAKDLGISTLVASYQTSVVIALNGKSQLILFILDTLRVTRHRALHLESLGECIWSSTYIFSTAIIPLAAPLLSSIPLCIVYDIVGVCFSHRLRIFQNIYQPTRFSSIQWLIPYCVESWCCKCH
jgi:hypothetical protein